MVGHVRRHMIESQGMLKNVTIARYRHTGVKGQLYELNAS